MGPEAAGSQHWEGLTRQGREVHLDRAAQQPRIGRHPVTFGDDDDVPWHKLGRGDGLLCTVPEDACLLWQICGQRLDGILGVPFLDEREHGVDPDHHDDRESQWRRAGDLRQAGRQP